MIEDIIITTLIGVVGIAVIALLILGSFAFMTTIFVMLSGEFTAWRKESPKIFYLCVADTIVFAAFFAYSVGSLFTKGTI